MNPIMQAARDSARRVIQMRLCMMI